MASQVSLYHQCSRRKSTYVSTLGTEEVSDMPLGTAGNNYLSFYRRPTALTARTEQLVIIEMTEKSHRFVPIFGFQSLYLFERHIIGDCNLETLITLLYASDSLIVFLIWLRVKGDTLQICSALMTPEAFGMEPFTSCCQNASSDRKSTVRTQCSRPLHGWCVVWLYLVGSWSSGRMMRKGPNLYRRLSRRIRQRPRRLCSRPS